MTPNATAATPVRSATDRKLLGVCAGFAHHYGIDPLVVRIAIVVLTLFGGLGLVLYLAAAAWLPEPGEPGSPMSGSRTVLAILAVLIGLLVVPAFVFGSSDAAGVLVIIALVAGAVVLTRRTAPTPTPIPAPIPQEVPAMHAPAPDVGDYGTLPYPTAPLVPDEPTVAYQSPPPRRRSYLGAAVLSVSLVWFGLAWLLNGADITSMSAVTIFGVSLLILGAGILVGAWFGRARWLVLLALPLSLVVWGLSAVPDSVELGNAPDWVGDGVGERYVPAGAESFALGLGSATVDVAQWADSDVRTLDASVGVGELVILVPDNWDVVVAAEVGFGGISRDGVSAADGSDLTERLVFDSPDPDAPRMVIEAAVDLGEVRAVTISTTQGEIQ